MPQISNSLSVQLQSVYTFTRSGQTSVTHLHLHPECVEPPPGGGKPEDALVPLCDLCEKAIPSNREPNPLSLAGGKLTKHPTPALSLWNSCTRRCAAATDFGSVTRIDHTDPMAEFIKPLTIAERALIAWTRTCETIFKVYETPWSYHKMKGHAISFLHSGARHANELRGHLYAS